MQKPYIQYLKVIQTYIEGIWYIDTHILYIYESKLYIHTYIHTYIDILRHT